MEVFHDQIVEVCRITLRLKEWQFERMVSILRIFYRKPLKTNIRRYKYGNISPLYANNS